MLLEVKELVIEFTAPGRKTRAVDQVSFTLDQGETLALVGETGCGKSVLCRSIPGLLPRRGRITQGQILWEGQNLVGLSERELLPFRGEQIGMVFQNPQTAFDPAMTVGEQLEEALRLGEVRTGSRAALSSAGWLELVEIDHPKQRLEQYPWQFSGGMLQRVAIAMALCRTPRLLIADEPTTALDVTVQANLLDLIRRIQKDTSIGILLVTHDLGVAAQMTNRVAYMERGRLIRKEELQKSKLYMEPLEWRNHEPHKKPAKPPDQKAMPVLEVCGLCKSFSMGRGHLLQAVEDVSFSLRAGEVFGLVGESGAGKTTVGQCVAGLLKPSGGTVKLHGANVQMLFQNSAWAVNPRMTLEEIVAEPFDIRRMGRRKERRAKARELLELVELGSEYAGRFPGDCSGGQLQRAAIARALATSPELLVADEPLASQDLRSQARMAALLERLARERGMAVLLITHDLAMVRRYCSRVAVMKEGKVTEQGETAKLYESPAHPYTRELIAAMPPEMDLIVWSQCPD